jgi:hypothetical protein
MQSLKRAAFGATFFLSVLSVVPASGHAQSGAPIQMLPPLGADDNPCTGALSGLLVWDGVNPIRCIAKSAGVFDPDKQQGYVGFGTQTPERPLHLVWTSDVYDQKNAPLVIENKGQANSHLEIRATNPNAASGVTFSIGPYYSTTNSASFTYSHQNRRFEFIPDVSNVGYSPKAFIETDGNIKSVTTVQVGNTTATCNAASAGKIRYNVDVFEGCDGTSWINFAGKWAGYPKNHASITATATGSGGTVTCAAYTDANGAPHLTGSSNFMSVSITGGIGETLFLGVPGYCLSTPNGVYATAIGTSVFKSW